MSHAYVGRQPVFDRRGEVFAYELLFRDGPANRADFSDPNRATSHVILGAFLELGIDRVAGSRPVFVNCTREFLIGEHPLPPWRDRLFVEVLEDVRIDAQLVAAVRGLYDAGYRIALDDFVYRPELEPLLECAHAVKLDILALGREGVRAQLAQLGRYTLDLVAEKVDNHDDHAFCLDLGFRYFQGYFLEKPEVLAQRVSPTDRSALVRILSLLHAENTALDAIGELVERDLSLSYRLLRCVNSPLYGQARRVAHVRQAIAMLGLTQVRQWVSLLLLSGASHKPHALLETALVRAKMSELLAQEVGHGAPEALFTAGMFSVLDALLDMTMDEILARLPLADEIDAALRGLPGPATDLVMAVRQYEMGRFDAPILARYTPEMLGRTWLSAVEWARAAGQLARIS